MSEQEFKMKKSYLELVEKSKRGGKQGRSRVGQAFKKFGEGIMKGM